MDSPEETAAKLTEAQKAAILSAQRYQGYWTMWTDTRIPAQLKALGITGEDNFTDCLTKFGRKVRSLLEKQNGN